MKKNFEKVKNRKRLLVSLVFSVSGLAFFVAPFGFNLAYAESPDLEGAKKEQSINLKAAQDSQKEVDKIHEQTQTIKNQYRQVLQSIENNKIFNDQMREVIASQKTEMDRVKKDIANIKDMSQKISPLMTKMKDSLAAFVKADTPFLIEERLKRIKGLEELFVQSGVSLSEKYRKVLEAYLVENDYGSTLEAYTDKIEIEGQTLRADFLKVGRLALYYLTKDLSYGGVWNPQTKNWQPLSSSQRDYVHKALLMAQKKSAPSLLTVPVFKSASAVKGEE